MTIIPMSSCKDSKQYNFFEEINKNDLKKPSTIPPLFREVIGNQILIMFFLSFFPFPRPVCAENIAIYMHIRRR